MKIRYQPLNGIQNLVIMHALGHPKYGNWKAGQERDVPDDEMIRWRLADRGPVKVVRAVDALLSCGIEFVDAATGVHPDYTCSACGVLTTAGAFVSDAAGAQSNVTSSAPQLTPYTTEAAYDEKGLALGDTLCVACFLAKNPNHIAHHVRLGFDQSVIDEVHARRRGEQPRHLAALAPTGAAAAALLEADSSAIPVVGLPASSAIDPLAPASSAETTETPTLPAVEKPAPASLPPPAAAAAPGGPAKMATAEAESAPAASEPAAAASPPAGSSAAAPEVIR